MRNASKHIVSLGLRLAVGRKHIVSLPLRLGIKTDTFSTCGESMSLFCSEAWALAHTYRTVSLSSCHPMPFLII